MYVGADGTIHQGGQPWGLRKIIGLFWAFIDFFVKFFKTLFNFDTKTEPRSGNNGSKGSGPADGPGARKRIGRINTLPTCDIPGGG